MTSGKSLKRKLTESKKNGMLFVMNRDSPVFWYSGYKYKCEAFKNLVLFEEKKTVNKITV